MGKKLSAAERAELEAKLAEDAEEEDDEDDAEEDVKAGAVVLHGKAAERYLARREQRAAKKPPPDPAPDPDPDPAPTHRYFR
jgi:hypothetical protein